jgi:hypothetical protein
MGFAGRKAKHPEQERSMVRVSQPRFDDAPKNTSASTQHAARFVPRLATSYTPPGSKWSMRSLGPYVAQKHCGDYIYDDDKGGLCGPSGFVSAGEVAAKLKAQFKGKKLYELQALGRQFATWAHVHIDGDPGSWLEDVSCALNKSCGLIDIFTLRSYRLKALLFAMNEDLTSTP